MSCGIPLDDLLRCCNQAAKDVLRSEAASFVQHVVKRLFIRSAELFDATSVLSSFDQAPIKLLHALLQTHLLRLPLLAKGCMSMQSAGKVHLVSPMHKKLA